MKVTNDPGGSGGVFATTRPAVRDGSGSSRNGRHESANERREDFVQQWNCPLRPKPSLNGRPAMSCCFCQTYEFETWATLPARGPTTDSKMVRAVGGSRRGVVALAGIHAQLVSVFLDLDV